MTALVDITLVNADGVHPHTAALFGEPQMAKCEVKIRRQRREIHCVIGNMSADVSITRRTIESILNYKEFLMNQVF